jgi:hypothetical protein
MIAIEDVRKSTLEEVDLAEVEMLQEKEVLTLEEHKRFQSLYPPHNGLRQLKTIILLLHAGFFCMCRYIIMFYSIQVCLLVVFQTTDEEGIMGLIVNFTGLCVVTEFDDMVGEGVLAFFNARGKGIFLENIGHANTILNEKEAGITMPWRKAFRYILAISTLTYMIYFTVYLLGLRM